MPDPETPEQLIARAQAQAAMAQEQLNRNVNTVIQQGYEDYGQGTFDTLSQDLSDAIGKENVGPVMASIIQCDAPTRVIQHLAEFPDEAKRIASMPPARRQAALARIENQVMPNGPGNVGADPAWVGRAKGGESRSLGDDVSDAVWERNFKRKYHTDGGLDPRKLFNR
jgi:hypothetical protein